MKLPWLSVLVVLGVAMSVRAKEEETNHLQNLQSGRQATDAEDIADTVAGAADTVTNTVTEILAGTAVDPVSAIMLAIGNVLGLIDDVDLTNLKPLVTGAGGTAAGVAAGALGTGAAAVGTTALTAASSLKSAVLGLLLKPLDFANGILAIVGLVLLIAYLITSQGDVGSLVGGTGFLRRDSDDLYYDNSYSSYVSQARALWDAPIVQRLATVVQEAITKYD